MVKVAGTFDATLMVSWRACAESFAGARTSVSIGLAASSRIQRVERAVRPFKSVAASVMLVTPAGKRVAVRSSAHPPTVRLREL